MRPTEPSPCPPIPVFLPELFDGVMRFNNILIDFDRDVWSYIRCARPVGLAGWLARWPGAQLCHSAIKTHLLCIVERLPCLLHWARWVHAHLCPLPRLLQPGLLQAAHHCGRGRLLHHASQGEGGPPAVRGPTTE